MKNDQIKKSKIKTMSVVAMIYSIIASGAFGIEEMVPECGPGLTLVLLAVLALVFALPFALLCAEAGSARPGEGGSLLWVKEGLGEFWFGIMVICQGIWSLVCNAIYIVLAVNYLGLLFPMSESLANIIKIAIVLIFYIINLLGIKESSTVTDLLTIAVLVTFGIATIVGFANFKFNPFEPFFSGEYDTSFQHIGAGLSIGMWMYAGFDELSVLSGEIENSEKVLPKAIMISVPLIALSNILPTMAGLASVGSWENWTTELSPGAGVGYITILSRFAGPIMGAIFVLIAAFCKFASFNTILGTDSRCIMVLSNENFGPKFLSEKLTKKGVPYISLTLVAIVTILMIPFEFSFLVIVDVFFSIVVTLLTLAAVWSLKNKLDPREYKFSIPGGKKTNAALCILVAVVCIFGLLVNGADWFLGGLIWTLMLPILYIVSKRLYLGCSKLEPDLYPINPVTGLGYGDLKKIGYFYSDLGAFSVLASRFIFWNESSWAYDYYQDFDSMIASIQWICFGAFIAGLIILWICQIYNRKKQQML